MSVLSLDWTHRGQTFQLGVGDLVRVSLWGNGTTGFQWSAMPMPDGPLEEVETALIGALHGAEMDPPRVHGSGSLRELTFRGTRPGEAKLMIRYWRGVEAPEDVIYQVTINVRDDSEPDDAQTGGPS